MTVDELGAYGLAEMEPAAIDQFLESQSVGVLGLPATPPYVVPMSYAYADGDLYLTYVVGGSSRKTELTEAAETASFLVFSVETMFSWRSVTLVGEPVAVPQRQWGELSETLADVWRPELFRTGGTDVRIYRLEVTDRTGIEHTDLAPAHRE